MKKIHENDCHYKFHDIQSNHQLESNEEKLKKKTGGRKVHTTLAFVHTYPDGDRDFSFYRNPGADMMLRKEEVSLEKICASKIFHFGTLSFTHAGIRTASQYAIQCAKEAGALISFDPNLREPLW